MSDPKLSCGHSVRSWYSICSVHRDYKESCGLCNTGRCIECIPSIKSGDRFPTFDRKTGEYVNAFPNLGRAK